MGVTGVQEKRYKLMDWLRFTESFVYDMVTHNAEAISIYVIFIHLQDVTLLEIHHCIYNDS